MSIFFIHAYFYFQFQDLSSSEDDPGEGTSGIPDEENTEEQPPPSAPTPKRVRTSQTPKSKAKTSKSSADSDIKILETVSEIQSQLLEFKKKSKATEPSEMEISPEESECKIALNLIKVKLMKLPNKAREALLDKFVSMSSLAVTKCEEQASAQDNMPVFTMANTLTMQSAQTGYVVSSGASNTCPSSMFVTYPSTSGYTQQSLQQGQNIQQPLIGYQASASNTQFTTLDEDSIAALSRNIQVPCAKSTVAIPSLPGASNLVPNTVANTSSSATGTQDMFQQPR